MELVPNFTFFGQCRCCLTEGNHRDLYKEYSWNGIREVYADLFVECFSLDLASQKKLTTLVCTACINRLRDASNFKIQVINTEKQLIDSLRTVTKKKNVNSRSAISNKIINEELKVKNQQDLKIESWAFSQKDEPSSDGFSDPDGVGDSCDTDYFEDIIHETNNPELVAGEAKLLKRFPKETLKLLPERAALKNICKGFVMQLEALAGKEIIGKSIEGLLEKRKIKKENFKTTRNSEKPCVTLNAPPTEKKIQPRKYKEKDVDMEREKNPYTVERLMHAANITCLLEFSNVTPFKSKHQRAYPCFYCESRFEDFEELRKHQKIDHTKENIGQCVLKKYKVGKPDALVVNVDVTDLRCTICNKSIPNLKELKTHLIGVHQKKVYLELSDRVIPFKVRENNFHCQICGTLYETFGSIERHMNVHYRNYVCEECSSGFVTKHRLKIHGYLMHSKKAQNYPCDKCQKVFNSSQRRKIHVDTVHENLKKFKCTRCPERFNDYFRRHKHLVVVHGVAPIEYKCNVCDRTFDRRYSLSLHMRTHIQQKDVQCELCPYKCFTNVALRHHMVKHNGERKFECSVCKKSYPREKTLKEHMKIHTNDRRFVCPVCGAAFIQKCSLKGHIKSHHKEHEIT